MIEHLLSLMAGGLYFCEVTIKGGPPNSKIFGAEARVNRCLGLLCNYVKIMNGECRITFELTDVLMYSNVQHPKDISNIRYHTCVDSSWPHCTAPSVEEEGTESLTLVDVCCCGVSHSKATREIPQTTISSCFM